MNDQESAAQPAREETQQATARQPERSGGRERDRDRGRRRHGHQQQNQQRRTDQQLPMDELRNLFALFTEHGLTEFELEREGFRIHLGRNNSAAQTIPVIATPVAQPVATQLQTPQPVTPVQNAQTAPAVAAASAQGETEPTAKEDEGLHIIVSPIVGTFYRSPSPTSEPFVRLGSHVNADTVVCIIEAMKLMNEIQAETSGEIAKIYVENGQPVEFGQPLFGVKK